ncbi:asparagine synthase (glutamine-hydrolyzing) [Desulfovibrio inopinatus]|uniref:asparagine synthase (glutamine-hydrolyzing) n=1 Tax=Desulfovibrio inopinatus TaxID=102109 RepID=UPI000422F00D|nr:asparagine synthase (glutamine-hydrolyzing) [Desulfovibrio inopinatus]
MCGICGFVGSIDRDALNAMNAALARRGPDGEGVFIDTQTGVHLGHRRLAILDIAGGHQPMALADDSLIIVFNGEIYNHRELRTTLEAEGCVFQTDHSDTEVLLHGYARWGTSLPTRLNGMWAFVLYDRARHRLFASRDRFGKKPFYYSNTLQGFAFASELTALGVHPSVETDWDMLSLAKYFAYGFIPAPRSLYQGVQKLPAGSNLVYDINSQSLHIDQYYAFCLEPDESLARDGEDGLAEELSMRLRRAVACRLEADVPLGVFLSGGIDSSTIAALAVDEKGHADAVHTFAVGFADPRFDESGYAENVARFLGTTHHTQRLEVHAGLQMASEIAGFLDEPMGDSSLLPTALLCRETRKSVTVALGGDGADELFAGYAPFKALGPAMWYDRLMPPRVHQAIRLAAARLPVSHGYMTFAFKVNRFLRGMGYNWRVRNPVWLGPLAPDEVSDLLSTRYHVEELYSEAIEVFERCPSTHPMDKTLEFYTRLYLVDDILTKLDRASMMFSLEARAPFLDLDVVDFAQRLPRRFKYRHGQTKYLLRRAMAGRIPEEVLQRGKHGFALPVGQWFANGALHIDQHSAPPGCNLEILAQKCMAHKAGKSDERLFLWNIWLLQHREVL